MNKLKRLLTGFLFATSLLGLSSCDNGNNPSPVAKTEEEEISEAKLSAKAKVREEYEEESEDASYDDQVTLDIIYQALINEIDNLE